MTFLVNLVSVCSKQTTFLRLMFPNQRFPECLMPLKWWYVGFSSSQQTKMNTEIIKWIPISFFGSGYGWSCSLRKNFLWGWPELWGMSYSCWDGDVKQNETQKPKASDRSKLSSILICYLSRELGASFICVSRLSGEIGSFQCSHHINTHKDQSQRPSREKCVQSKCCNLIFEAPLLFSDLWELYKSSPWPHFHPTQQEPCLTHQSCSICCHHSSPPVA